MLDYKSNRELLEEYNQHIRGHIEAKKAIISLVNRSKMRYYQKYKHLDDQYHLIEPAKLLLIGPSGHGKTFLVEVAARIMDFPLLKVDATTMSSIGRSDGITADGLRGLILNKAKELNHVKKLEYKSIQGTIDQTVVFIDEVDKLAKAHDSTGNWNKHIQESFLTMFDAKDEFAGVSFIFAGAFTGIEKQRNTSNSIGFNTPKEETTSDIEWDQEVIKFGLVPELVGRIRSMHRLDSLTEQDYKSILKDILLPTKQDELIYFNHVGLSLKPHEINKMVKNAMASGQGVRSLKRSLDAYCADLEFYYEDVATETLLLENMMNRYGSQAE